MERRIRQTVVAVAVAIAGTFALPGNVLANGQASTGKQPLRMTVRVDDQAGIQGDLLKFAKARAAEVFAMSGVLIEWVDGRDAKRLNLSVPYMVLIMAEAPPSLRTPNGRGADVMGQSVPIANRAYVYYDRLTPTIIPPRDIVTTLGDVIAHELGHLMLPPGHSSTGIMRANINMHTRRVETFTEEEAVRIHSLLEERQVASNLNTN